MHRLKRMARSLARTCLQAAPTILLILLLGFGLLHLAPGDMVDVMTAEAGGGSVETNALLRQSLGLDQPMLKQFFAYFGNLAQFSLGDSPRYGRPVFELIMARLPSTLTLMATSIALAAVLGIGVGALMFRLEGRAAARPLSALMLVLYSTPSFWIGILLVLLFGVHLQWLPTGGYRTVGASLSGLDFLLDRLRFLILPTLALTCHFMAVYAQVTRSSLRDAARQDHVRTAVGKGLPPGRVLRGHILRNGLLPVITLIGVHAASILGGAVVIESVFAWPGMGRLAYEAVLAREYVVVLGVIFVSALTVIAVNAVVDLAQAALDPRIGAR